MRVPIGSSTGRAPPASCRLALAEAKQEAKKRPSREAGHPLDAHHDYRRSW
ncbi:hypothetical protein ABTY20_09430 [Streptomyces sp. NPDC126497]|uniref:hypothetical protein n=1 Tax=Streptomyces sp. NPDC126497 TaxID=3155313 RepID=UPI003332F38E